MCFCKNQRGKHEFHCFKTWAPQHDPSGPDPAVCFDQRDLRRLRSGGTGISYPGLGQAAVSAGLGSDIPLLMGITMISAAMVFAGNFIADILYEIIDPRMRRGAK